MSDYIVVIRTFTADAEAEAARAALAAAGIRALLLREVRPGVVAPPGGPVRPVRLAVDEDDAVAARALLDAGKDAPPPAGS